MSALRLHNFARKSGLLQIRASMFQWSDFTPLSCRAEQDSPWHLVRALARWQPQLQLPHSRPEICGPWGLYCIQMETA